MEQERKWSLRRAAAFVVSTAICGWLMIIGGLGVIL